MAADIEKIVIEQEKELRRYADDVELVRRRLRQYRDGIDEAWRSSEVRGIDEAVDDVRRRLGRIVGELDEIGHDILKAYQMMLENPES